MPESPNVPIPEPDPELLVFRQLIEEEGLGEETITSREAMEDSGVIVVPPEVQQQIEAEIRRQEKQAQAQYHVALHDVDLSILNGGEGGTKFIVSRHNQHYEGGNIVKAFQNFRQNNDARTLEHHLSNVRENANKYGIALDPYVDAQIQRRFLEHYPSGHGRYLFVEACACHPDPKHEWHNKKVPAADAQFKIPDVHHAEHVIKLPQEGDDILSSELVSTLSLHPHASAKVESVQSAKQMIDFGLDTASLGAGMNYIATHLNPSRKEKEIRYISIALPTVRGIEFPDGERIMLDDIGIKPIHDEHDETVVRRIRHMKWERFEPAYVLKNRSTPVRLTSDFSEHPHTIITDSSHYVSEITHR